jgi:hypothetical protein
MFTNTFTAKTNKKMVALGASLLFVLSFSSLAGPREQAKRLHDRLAGIPPTEAVLTEMQADITAGNNIAAANKAMSNDAFYSVTLKNWVTPWTNEAQTVFAPLNDYTATVIGMIRDDIDIREMLYSDIIYTAPGQGLTAHSNSNNSHYEEMETQALQLGTVLTRATQSSITGLETGATAGVLTSRAAAKAFLIDGTNRAHFRFTLLNHLCTDLEQIKDVERAADRIRQDISRSPGGDSRIYMNACYGCHAGMDPMAQSLAYYNYDYNVDADPDGDNGELSYNSASDPVDPVTGTRVKAKYHNNKFNFPTGFVTPDDEWTNYWRTGQNQLIGWDQSLTGKGYGAKSMGQELSHSTQYARCQVEKVFQNVCLRVPVDAADRSQIDAMVTSLSSNGYKLKQTFAESAVYCMGE